MKDSAIKTLGLLVLVTVACRCVHAQGTVYLSNLGAPSTGSYSVASNSWLAFGFRTGSDPAGYLLDSVTLAMLDATGNPSSVVVSIYWSSIFAPRPGSSLSPLLGTTDPQAAGTYAYMAPPNLELRANAHYFIALSAGTALAEGAYRWSTTGTSPTDSGNDWAIQEIVWISPDGLVSPLNWSPIQPFTYPQFALNATAIPEPSSFALLGLGGVCVVAGMLGRRRVVGA